jgi:superfamily II DNA or RNA helicase
LEHLDLLIVDEVHALDAEAANLLLAEKLALSAAARATGTAWTSRATGTAFTALAATPAGGTLAA